MKTIFMSKKEIQTYPLFTKKGSEATIRQFSKTELIKEFSFYSEQKNQTLEYLEKKEQELNKIPELLLFKAYIKYANNIQGILINKGYEMNLDEYNKIATFQELITILKRIGEVLNRLSCLRKKEHLLTTFFIGDIHEENILVDKATKKIQFVDLDSCKIENNYAFNAKYLQFLKTYSCVNKELSFKYPKNRFYYDKNENTDLFCYAALILKYLFFIPLPILSLEEFYKQIYLLKEQGLPKSLYQSFLNLYTHTNNTNPYLYLEEIPSFFEKEWQRKRTL